MRQLVALAWKSAVNRRFTLGLTLVAIAVSVSLLLGIERLRHEARRSFAQSVSGVDLVVGARGSPVQLMLYAVFRMGEATNNVSWSSVEMLGRHRAVAWTVPLSLGDSHRGFPVLGTTTAYFDRFRYGESRPLALAQGRPFADVFEAVLGAEVAQQLGYQLGQQITLSHGTGPVTLAEHADKPFTAVGILAPTGTPVDRTVHISLEGMEAIHLDWQAGAPIPGLSISAAQARKFDLTPKTVTAVLVGLKSRAAVFAVQRDVQGYGGEPLMAVLPGVTLDQLWEVVGVAERALQAAFAMVVAVGLAGLAAVILAGLNERRRELAILRSVGARPGDVFLLLALEGSFVALAGALLGLACVNGLAIVLRPVLENYFGLSPRAYLPGADELALLGIVALAGALISTLPAYRAYRLSLADGLSPRL